MPTSSNPSDRFAIIPILPGQTPPATAIMHGSIQPITEFLRMNEVRNSALTAMLRADNATTELAERKSDLQTRQLQLLCTALDTLTQRFDAYEARRAEQLRQDEEAEAERVQREIDALPDPENPSAHGHFNTGDLSPMPPTVDAESEYSDLPAPEQRRMSDPDLETEDDNDSDVLPARYSRQAPIGVGPLKPKSKLKYPETPEQRSPAAVSLGSLDNDDEGDPTLGASTPPGHTGY